MTIIKVIKDQEEHALTRFINFSASGRRFEFAFLKADYLKDDTLVVDLLGNHNFSLNHQTLHEKGHLEQVFHISQVQADELRECLDQYL
ncbi:SAV0927 family protein [Halobacillus sp. Marseille-P3879]|uniref:SAV0927 family protein n=1 Tax=Halobacillus TaxID=45667 RepID=UPI000C7AF853|nr:SAV0927 family protein [Halobacillus sp. Marseille-P3879]